MKGVPALSYSSSDLAENIENFVAGLHLHATAVEGNFHPVNGNEFESRRKQHFIERNRVDWAIRSYVP